MRRVATKLFGMGWIYLGHCNANGKMYVGQTKQKRYEQRWLCHKSDAKTGRLKCHLHRSIRKYGWESFKWSVLLQTPNDQLDFWETHFIDKFDTVKSGLNEMPGGQHISPMEVPEIKQRRIDKMKEPDVHAKWLASITKAQQNPEQKQLLSKLCKERCQDPQHMKKRREGQERFLSTLDEAERKNVIDRMATPEATAKRVKALKATLATTEGKTNKSNATTNSWKDPVSRAKRIAALKKSWQNRTDSKESKEKRLATFRATLALKKAKAALSISEVNS